jgi:branched-chain amino acid transport system substrate-binding protein
MKSKKLLVLTIVVCTVLLVLVPAVMSGCAQPTPTTPTPTPTVKEIKIGGVHPLTGVMGSSGRHFVNCMQIAVDDINAAGGIKSLGGAKLVVIQGDSQGTPELGQAETERLIQEGAVAVIGTIQTAVTLNATQVCERAQVPFIIDVSVANEICERGFKYTFRLQPNATAMVKGCAENLKRLRDLTGQPVDTAVTIHEDSAFGTGLAEGFGMVAPAYGIKLLDDIAYSLRGLTDLTTEMSKVKALKPDLLVHSGYPPDAILILRTAQELNVPIKAVVGLGSPLSAQQVVTLTGKAGDYSLECNYAIDVHNPKDIELASRFKAKYGEELTSHGLLAHQAVYIVADAIERAKSADPKAIRDALATTNYKDHLLPYLGPIRFDEKGECINAYPIMMQVQKGQVFNVLPQELATAKPIYPMVPWDKR